MGLKIYPPTDYIITQAYMDKIITTDSAATTTPVPDHTTQTDSSVVVLTGDDGYIDLSFINVEKIASDVYDDIFGGSNTGKIPDSSISALTAEEIDEIYDSVFGS